MQYIRIPICLQELLGLSESQESRTRESRIEARVENRDQETSQEKETSQNRDQENRNQEMSKEPRTRDELKPREPRVKNGQQENQDQEVCSKIINY